MSISVPDFWWPIDFSDAGQDKFLEKKAQYAKENVLLDQKTFDHTNGLIERMMRTDLQEILDRDSIPNLCHVLNGWGNSWYQGKRLVDELHPFIFLKGGDKPYIEQCTPEGDFHPWQSFAYSAMAGIAGDAIIGNTGFTLKNLMENSTRIHHDEGEELGHLLFALAVYFKSDENASFKFNNGDFSSQALLDWGIENHITGSYRVCRKFHLTEGICAMASLNENFKAYRLVAQKFLEGQVDLIILIAILLEESLDAIEKGIPLNEDSLVHEFREQLVVLDYLENHVYYAGHIIELAGLARIMGYEISPAQNNAILRSINCLNRLIPLFAPKMSFVDCFLGFGHYRRAITLYRLIIEDGNCLGNWDLLEKYTLNFDAIEPILFDHSAQNLANEKLATGVFRVIDPQSRINPKLAEIIEYYNASEFSKTHQLRGKFAHFRRVCPQNWPKSVHFELLDYGSENGKVGVEIHLESEEVKFINTFFPEIIKKLEAEFNEVNFISDPTWYSGSGRILAVFSYQKYNAGEIAKAFIQLIETTEEMITELLQTNYVKINQ